MALIVVLSVLAGFSVPNYFRYTDAARSADTKSTLGTVRAAISSFAADTDAEAATPSYPTLSQLETAGTVVAEPIPVNPFNQSGDVQIASWDADAPPVSGTAGWNYDPETGRFWANSNTDNVHESGW